MHSFEDVRISLLKEASQSPNLLSDLAGLEKYIAESYHNRSFIELLQNADDAGASNFKIIRKNNTLLVANNGRLFDESDLESLCRSAASNKIRGNSIGYRGIGFKSVVGFAKKIHLISGNLNITFSKELTNTEIPQATNVPLIRIPHFNDFKSDEELYPVIEGLLKDGFKTIFVFNEIIANEIENEFVAFNYLSLLFLRNIEKVEILTEKSIKVSINKKSIKLNKQLISFEFNGEKSNWVLFYQNENGLAFNLQDSRIVKLKEEESLVFAFLPTEDITGLGIIINGDFNTDPSRRHIIIDNHTINSIETISILLNEIIEDSIRNNEVENADIINAITPYIDPRLSVFKKQSFSSVLLNKLQHSTKNSVKSIYLSPPWLNVNDYDKVAKQSSLSTINKSFYNIEGFIEFLKFLGAKEARFSDIQSNLNKIRITNKGCADILAFLIKKSISENIDIKYFNNIPLLVSDGNQLKIDEIHNDIHKIDDTYLNFLSEKGLTGNDLGIFFSKYLNKDLVNQLFELGQDKITPPYFETFEPKTEDEIQNWFDTSKINLKNYEEELSLKRWRSAEQQVLTILNKKGFRLEDVSRQNVGYDLEGYSPNGDQLFIEVKSIDLPGQKFRLTNNEVALAQEKQNSYYLAIVRQTNDYIEIALINNPIENLPLNRQCVQWIWECINYDYKPLKFKIE